jgi:hypothetical protein
VLQHSILESGIDSQIDHLCYYLNHKEHAQSFQKNQLTILEGYEKSVILEGYESRHTRQIDVNGVSLPESVMLKRFWIGWALGEPLGL